MKTARRIGMIGAFSKNGVFGIGSDLAWSDPTTKKSLLPSDMKHFVDETRKSAPEGKTNILVVGRRTAESFGNKPLPGRHLIVLSRENQSSENGLIYASSIKEALEKAENIPDAGHIFFGGGEAVWAGALPYCTHAYITVVEKELPIYEGVHCCTHFLKKETWREFYSQKTQVTETWDGELVVLTFIDYIRHFQ